MWHTYYELNSSVSRGKSQKEHPLSHLFFWLVLLAKFCDHELVFFHMLPLIIWLCRSLVYTKLAASLDKRWGCERTKKSRGITTICEYEKKHSSCRENICKHRTWMIYLESKMIFYEIFPRFRKMIILLFHCHF